MIVSDSTTLIILFDLHRLELLSNLFEKVFIPKAVYDEISAKKEITLPASMEVKAVHPCDKLDTLKMLLDDGESEAIALALSLKMPLIIDEKKGRKIALQEGIKIIGLLGVVYLNIKKAFLTVEDAQAFLEEARSHGYRISQHLIDTMFEHL